MIIIIIIQTFVRHTLSTSEAESEASTVARWVRRVSGFYHLIEQVSFKMINISLLSIILFV